VIKSQTPLNKKKMKESVFLEEIFFEKKDRKYKQLRRKQLKNIIKLF